MSFDIEKTFSQFDQLITTIESTEGETYLDSIIYALRAIQTEEELELPNPETEETLRQLKETFLQQQAEAESIRKVIQLALIKGMKGSTQQQHVTTPDSVALFIGYLLEKLLGEKEQFRLFDPAVGAANLLTAVINQIEPATIAYGAEIDPTLIQIATESANVQRIGLELFHQDSLTSLLLAPVDAVVSDLPVGYYPNDQQASQFVLQAETGHSYAHHLFIEQSMTYTKETGYLIFLIPNFLFTSDQSEPLQKFLRDHAHILALLQLPLSMFSSEQQAKSILVLQKQGEGTKPPKQTLMAQLPSFKEVRKTQNILEKIDAWFEKEISK
ncbi:class I SAM-dependent methyltransferase [Gracilibacillus alcaliphilus]|uniref:class I SAM-dependent methyltransferase n=1 Tax=Gracilibacillus alcaliphilus TaxID=1401441 RepID=UPI00195781FE|nr:class I SAM-dependent methyltransferase [Gracilibacillus alcaliphilus]MBM7676883.1 site-specific DNA-methyltransferase (adenine-specific) [Gracilibacillus alcaliphilus]